MLERVFFITIITIIGGIAGLLLGGLAYGVAIIIGHNLGIGPILIISGGTAVFFFIRALVDEWNLP